MSSMSSAMGGSASAAPRGASLGASLGDGLSLSRVSPSAGGAPGRCGCARAGACKVTHTVSPQRRAEGLRGGAGRRRPRPPRAAAAAASRRGGRRGGQRRGAGGAAGRQASARARCRGEGRDCCALGAISDFQLRARNGSGLPEALGRLQLALGAKHAPGVAVHQAARAPHQRARARVPRAAHPRLARRQLLPHHVPHRQSAPPARPRRIRVSPGRTPPPPLSY